VLCSDEISVASKLIPADQARQVIRIAVGRNEKAHVATTADRVSVASEEEKNPIIVGDRVGIGKLKVVS
jgi:hypothetical protein